MAIYSSKTKTATWRRHVQDTLATLTAADTLYLPLTGGTLTGSLTTVGLTNTGSHTHSSAAPFTLVIESDAAAGNRNWLYGVGSEQFVIQAYDDAFSGLSEPLAINRTGTSIDSIILKTGASVTALTLDSSQNVILGGTSIVRSIDTSLLWISGGSSVSSGANLLLWGGTDLDFHARIGSNDFLLFDESAGSLAFSTGTGAKTTALTLDTSQNATFTGDILFSHATPQVRLYDTDIGASALSQAMSGIVLEAGGMNTTFKYTPALSFGSQDSEITNKGALCHIVGVAEQTYSGATTAAMGLEFWTNPNNAGYAPVLALTLDSSQDATFAGNVLLTHASSPELTLTDTTNSCTARMVATNTDARIGTTSAHKLTIHTGGTTAITISTGQDVTFAGDVILPAAGGIDFSANAGGGGDTSQLLDWYEEGTWTPILSDGTNNATHDSQYGYYTRIGNRVYVNGYISTTSLGSVSGSIRIKGLPFTSSNSTGSWGSGTVGYATGLSLTAGESITMYVDDNSENLRLQVWDTVGGITAMQSGEWTAAADMMFSANYFI